MSGVSLIFTVGILVGIIIFGAIAYRDEIRKWNGGRCERCHSLWKNFDMDSQGGRGYDCRCGRTIWISYPFVDRENKQ